MSEGFYDPENEIFEHGLHNHLYNIYDRWSDICPSTEEQVVDGETSGSHYNDSPNFSDPHELLIVKDTIYNQNPMVANQPFNAVNPTHGEISTALSADRFSVNQRPAYSKQPMLQNQFYNAMNATHGDISIVDGYSTNQSVDVAENEHPVAENSPVDVVDVHSTDMDNEHNYSKMSMIEKHGETLCPATNNTETVVHSDYIELTPIENSKNYNDQNGYVYSLNNNKPKLQNLYFRCKNSSGIHMCTARATAENKNLKRVKLTYEHTHLPDDNVLEKTKFDGQLETVIDSNKFMSTREMYFTAREKVPTDKAQFIPSRQSYNSFIHRRKKKVKPKNPKTVEEFEKLINSEEYRELYCFDQRNKTFYRGVWTDENGNKMVVFVSESALEVLKTLKIIEFLMDGTFKVLPRHIKFCQLYIMSFMYEERCYPFTFVFMEKRDTAAYDLLFRKLVEMITPECAAKVLNCMSDYESAVRKMCRKHFPNARIGGCYFHYVKAVHKRSRKFGLSNDVHFQQTVKELCALALLSNEYISEGFNVIVEKTENSAKWILFKNYWQRQWITANISVYGLRNRTDNFSESQNRSFNLLNGKPHQNIWIVLRNLKRMEMDKTDELLKHKAGKMFKARPPDKLSQNLNKKIREATDRFDQTEDVKRFLENITHNEQIQAACNQAHLLDDVDDMDDIENEEFLPNDFDENSNYQKTTKPNVSRKRLQSNTDQNPIKKRRTTKNGDGQIALFRKNS